MHTANSDANNLVHRQAHAKLAAWVEEAGGRAEVSVVAGNLLHEVLARLAQPIMRHSPPAEEPPAPL